MTYGINKLATAALLASTFVLSGCFGGGSGSGGIGGPGPIVTIPDPDGEPTGPIGSRVEATYSGNMAATFREGGSDGEVTTVAGTLSLDIDTDRVGPQIVASATGFSGSVTSSSGTENFDLDGSLAGEGSVDMDAGSVNFGLSGVVSVAGIPDENANVDLTGNGTFFGADAEQIDGTLTGRIFGEDDDGAWSDAGDGTFLLIVE